jgi:hypothetical protein
MLCVMRVLDEYEPKETTKLVTSVNTTRNFGFCNCRMQLKFSYMRHMQLQICVVAQDKLHGTCSCMRQCVCNMYIRC